MQPLSGSIYDRHIKHHVTSAKLVKALNQNPESAKLSSTIDPEKTTLQDLLNSLSSREITGNAAVEAIQAFLHANQVSAPHGIPDQSEETELPLMEVFMRVLDMNLKAGIAEKTLRSVQWPRSSGQIEDREVNIQRSTKKSNGLALTDPSEETVSSLSTGTNRSNDKHEDGLPVLEPPTRLGGFSCALGKTVLRKGLEKALQVPHTASSSHTPVSSGAPRWLASRKLDGVRLLVILDVFVPHKLTQGQTTKVLDLWTLSRSGKEYHTLDILKGDLTKALSGSGYIKALLANEPRYAPPPELAGQGYNQRMVLDGELCHLTYDQITPASENDAVKEDFAEVVSMVRRKNYTIQQPAMFLLDALPWSIFLDGMSKDSGAAGSYKVFAERVKDCEALVEQVAVTAREIGTQPVLRYLQQTEVTSIEQVENMIEEAAEKGWEGLILRRGDQPYEGRRR